MKPVLVGSSINGSALLAVIAGLFVLLWVVPAFLVALRAQSDGFAFGSYVLVGLFLSWPVALVITLTLGKRSPLVSALEGQVDALLLDD